MIKQKMGIAIGNVVNLQSTSYELQGFVEQFIPSVDCLVDELAIKTKFLNFTCKQNHTINFKSVNVYLTCIISLLLVELKDINLVLECRDVDFNYVGSMLADCKWQTPFGNLQVGGEFITNCHPISLPPQPESCLDLKLFLYTRLNEDKPQIINRDLSNMRFTNFNNGENTSILIGGYLIGNFKPYDKDLVSSILACKNQNVILFDWGKASAQPYDQANANARYAGIVLANFIKALNTKFNYPPSKVHLIGHSTGAQLAGFAGAAYPSIGRISGLDPAGSYFDCDGQVRLDPSDALFVDVIHTNAGGFATVKNLGHVDFWPNGGKTQKGCDMPSRLLQYPYLHDKFACDHSIAIYYFTSSMRFCDSSFNCTFNAYMCSDYSDFQSSKCDSCDVDGSKCAQMGYFAENYKWAGYKLPAKQPFYLNTTKTSPYCSN